MASSIEIEKTASAWLAKRDSGRWSDADQAEFGRWLRASTAHRVAFVRLEFVWEQTHRLKALGARAVPGHVPPPGEWRQPPFFERAAASVTGETATAATDVSTEGARPGWTSPEPAPVSAEDRATRSRQETLRSTRPDWRRPLSRAIAASLVLAFAFSSGWYFWPHGTIYRTDVGGLESVPLSDGSKVTLNTASEIRIAVTETERRVTLDQGEAFFEVAKDPTRPFVVSAGNKRIIAVGTKFSVRREADDVRVVVTEGRVRIERSGASGHVPVSQLSAGTVARAGDADTLVQEKPLLEAEEYVSWRTGYLVFRDTALGDAVAEFNRYNVQKIVIEDPAVAAMHVGGNFRSTNVDAFVRLIEQGFGIHAEAHGDQILLKAT
jgi:transmembrane sensor